MSTMFYFDCETSGLDPKRHAILQIAWIIRKKGAEVVRRSFDVQPEDCHDLNLKALEVNGFTMERMRKATPRGVMITRLYDDIHSAACGGPGLIPCGHNVKFDLDFLNEYLQKGTEKYTINYGGSSLLQMARPVCTLALCHYLNYRNILHLQDYKLKTVCDYFNIPINAHDALSDIEATATLLTMLNQLLNKLETFIEVCE